MERAKEQALKNEKRTDSNVRELIFLYDEAAARTEKEISTLFARYAKDNVLTSAEAAKLLEGKEYSRWQKSIEEYIADASGAAKNSKAMLELNTLAMKSRISRKEQLLGNIYRNTMDLAGDSTTKLDSLLGDILKVNYFEGCFNIQRELGVGFNVAKIDDKTIKSILDFAWSEKHYSEAVWGHCDHLAALTKRELTLGFIQGSSVQQMAKAIDNVMGKGRYAAERLVRTESKYFANQGELLSYKENGVKKYRFIGGGEGGSCICGSLNGQIYGVDEAKPGKNFPPIHPNCLCIIVAAYDHSIFEKREHAFPLKDNIKFKEWKEKYVENGGKSGIMKEIKLENIPITNAAIDKVPLAKCETLSRGQSKQLQKRHQELLRFVQDEPPGREAICYCDMKMKVVSQYLGKGMNAVNATKLEIPHIAVHNHPSGTTFTLNDLDLLMSIETMSILSAVGNDGSVFIVEKSKKFDAAKFARLCDKSKAAYPKYKDSPENYLYFMEKLLKEADGCGLRYQKITV